LQSRQLLETPVNLPEIATGGKSEISRRAMVAAGSALMPAIVSILAPTPAAATSDYQKGNGQGNGQGMDKGTDKARSKLNKLVID